MYAHGAPPRPNPIGRVPIIAASVMGVIGVTGFVLGVMARSSGAPPAGEGTSAPKAPRIPKKFYKAFVATQTGGGPGNTTQEDIDVMLRGAHGGQFTSWFTREVEREIISRLEDYRAKHGIKYCTPVTTLVDDKTFGPQKQTKWLSYAEPATRKILDDLYPNGAPWHGNQFLEIQGFGDFSEQSNGAIMSDTSPPIALYRYWLWLRVMSLANRYVCDFIPVT